VDTEQALALFDDYKALSTQERMTIKAIIHYDGYLDKQFEEAERFKAMELSAIPEALDYGDVKGMSIECMQKLSQTRPANLGQAARVSGVTPAALTSLMIHLKRAR